MVEYSFGGYVGRITSAFMKEGLPWARDNIVVSAFVLIAGALVYLRLHPEGTAIDWKVIRSTLLVLGGMFLLYCVIQLFRFSWKEDTKIRKERDDLALKIAPQLSIPRLIHPQPWVDERGNCISYFFDVLNDSESSTIEEIHVQLTAIEPPDREITYLPFPLHIKHDIPHLTEFSLHPKERRQIDLVSKVQANSHFHIEHIVSSFDGNLPAADHILTVTVSGRNTPSVARNFRVWVDQVNCLQVEAQ